MVEHIKYDLFPTAIVRSKCPSITPQDKKEMMDCTDWMIEQGMYTDNDLTPNCSPVSDINRTSSARISSLIFSLLTFAMRHTPLFNFK